jgi:hypothetical protein
LLAILAIAFKNLATLFDYRFLLPVWAKNFKTSSISTIGDPFQIFGDPHKVRDP